MEGVEGHTLTDTADSALHAEHQRRRFNEIGDS